MNAEKAKINQRRLFEDVNNRNWEAVDKWIDTNIADNYVNHSIAFDETPDREGVKKMFRRGAEIFPDMRLEIEEMVFEDDIMCFRFYSTQLGDDINDVAGMCMVKFADDKIIHRWVYSDIPK